MRPAREHATSNGQTYMITSSTWGRRSLFSRDVWAKLLMPLRWRVFKFWMKRVSMVSLQLPSALFRTPSIGICRWISIARLAKTEQSVCFPLSHRFSQRHRDSRNSSVSDLKAQRPPESLRIFSTGT